tara:strand:- start:114 stop:413 length:300 start_codon:yes stop_codon:yes gene_type:complete
MYGSTAKLILLICTEIILLVYFIFLAKRFYAAMKSGEIRDYLNRLLASSGNYMISSEGIANFPLIHRSKSPALFFFNLVLLLALLIAVALVCLLLPAAY